MKKENIFSEIGNMTEEILEPSELPGQAIKIIKLLIEFGCPKDSSEVSTWLKHVELLQTWLSNIWQSDPTGQTMVRCLNYLYNSIASNSTSVSPAVWTILSPVDDDKIADFVDGILSDSTTNDNIKIQNVLTAVIEGLCQCGPYIPRLQDWIPVIVKGLEARRNYAVLIDVSEKVIGRLVRTLIMPIFRPLTYPIFKQFLYPVTTPHVFYKIIDAMPEVLHFLQKDLDNLETKAIYMDLSGLIASLLVRFPPSVSMDPKYNAIKIVLMKLPQCTFQSDHLILWDLKFTRNMVDWSTDIFPHGAHQTRPQTPYKGLINQGNTCFMNSILQLLYMTTRFRKELLEKELDNTQRAARDLQQLFAFMQESKRSVLAPNGVLDSTLPPTFRRGQQQDSSEYLIYLLDVLDENEKKVRRTPKVNDGIAQGRTCERTREGEGTTSQKHYPSDENTIVERLFGGVSLSTTTCSSCNKSFPKKDTFRDLHLSVPDSRRTCDLQDLLDECLRPEDLYCDNMYDCASCGTKRNATRRHVILKAPEHLILTLKLFRFDSERKQRLKLQSKLGNAKSIELPVHDSSQLQTGVSFNRVLHTWWGHKGRELANETAALGGRQWGRVPGRLGVSSVKVVDHGSTGRSVVMYELKGAVLHSGSSLDGGHYFSSAVDEFGQWYIFNDSVVSVARCEWNHGPGTPYILFLRQCDVTDPPTGPLLSNLQVLVNRDNQKYLAERKFEREREARKKDSDDDWEEPPPSNGSLGGPGPSLVF